MPLARVERGVMLRDEMMATHLCGQTTSNHPFTVPHPTVYETSSATLKIFNEWKINVRKMKGLIVHPVV